MTWNNVIKNLHHCGQGDMLRAVTRLEFVKRKHNLAGMVESAALSPFHHPWIGKLAVSFWMERKPA